MEQKALSIRQLQAAEAEREAAEATYKAAIQKKEALAASLPPPAPDTGIDTANAPYPVVAPIDGIVTRIHKSLGERVAPGEAILEITDLDPVWVEAPVFERDLSQIVTDGTAIFTTSSYPGKEFSGRILHIGSVIDEQTRAVSVIFQVPNPGRLLRIGMQANVRLDAGERVKAILVPRGAVLEEEGKRIAYVLVSGEEFQRRELVVGDEYGERIAVLSGLRPGERVVTQGAYELKLQELRPARPEGHSHES
jgi:cobalt-zinc-cadmium efflux system membrane fusion protein